MGVKKGHEFVFSDGYVWLPDFHFDRETYGLLVEASRKSGMSLACEGLSRLKDHLRRFPERNSNAYRNDSEEID